MKKKSLSELLKKLEETQRVTENSLLNLNDQLSKKMLKGGYDNTNGTCNGGSNNSCQNSSCTGGFNGFCYNVACLI